MCFFLNKLGQFINEFKTIFFEKFPGVKQTKTLFKNILVVVVVDLNRKFVNKDEILILNDTKKIKCSD